MRIIYNEDKAEYSTRLAISFKKLEREVGMARTPGSAGTKTKARAMKKTTAKDGLKIKASANVEAKTGTKAKKGKGKLSTPEARREYQRRYYQLHKDKAKEFNNFA